MSYQSRADALCKRFLEELNYKSALAWPIQGREDEGRVMYHMVHATDHPEAPKLMYRAFHKATEPKESAEQLQLELQNLLVSPPKN